MEVRKKGNSKMKVMKIGEGEKDNTEEEIETRKLEGEEGKGGK